MYRAFFHIIVIGSFAQALAAAEVELSEDGGSVKAGYVFVEPTNVSLTKVGDLYPLKPYLERRHRWGKTFSVGYSTYEPIYYQPHFTTGDFVDSYSTPEFPMIELQFQVKRNLAIGSLAAEVSVGLYQNHSDVDKNIVDSTLDLYPIRLGANFALDSLGSEPFIVPYISGGIYTMMFNESQASVARKGNTQVAPYVTGGVQFMLDWLDRAAAAIAYRDSGIEASYLFLDVRKQMASGNAKDPDFENDVSFGGGLRVEF